MRGFVSTRLFTLVWATWALLVSPAQNSKTSGSPDHTTMLTGSMSLHTLKSFSNESMNLTSRSEDNKSCYPLTKCKPCSKLESLTAECVTTGYKQLEYCTNVKKKKFVGCHYSPDFNEERLFWTFEILCGLAGAVAYWVVLTRRREIEKMVARRIQRQINA
ncbi:hypothetical protein EMCRGX_G022566 [Ephydatia muelleri]